MNHWIRALWLMSGLAPALAGPAEANPLDLGVAEVEALGTLNGQALACGDFAGSKAAKDLVIRLVPKTRRFGVLFESATNAAFLAQGRSGGPCPSEAERSARLTALETQVRGVFPPGADPAAQEQDAPEGGEAKP